MDPNKERMDEAKYQMIKVSLRRKSMTEINTRTYNNTVLIVEKTILVYLQHSLE